MLLEVSDDGLFTPVERRVPEAVDSLIRLQLERHEVAPGAAHDDLCTDDLHLPLSLCLDGTCLDGTCLGGALAPARTLAFFSRELEELRTASAMLQETRRVIPSRLRR